MFDVEVKVHVFVSDYLLTAGLGFWSIFVLVSDCAFRKLCVVSGGINEGFESSWWMQAC